MTGILLFIGINFLCFLPAYILNFKNQPELLPSYLFSKTSLKNRLRLLLWKNSSDFFRINFDFAIIFILLIYFKNNEFLISICTVFCVLGTITFVYSQLITIFFERDISILNDLILGKSGLIFLGRLRYLVIPVSFLVILVLYFCFEFLISILIRQEFHEPSLLVLYFYICISGLYKINERPIGDYLMRTVISPTITLVKSCIYSIKQNKFKVKKDFIKQNRIENISLEKKPNVIVISVESLGQILFEKKDLYPKIAPLLKEFNDRLLLNDFKTAASYTESPIFSGGSWMAFSSFLCGMKIENELEYETIFKDPKNDNLQTLPSFLRSNNYKNYCLNSIVNSKRDKIDWKTLSKIFATENFINHDQLNYTGKLLKFMTLKAIPDEYTLNYAYNKIKNSAPYFMFFSSLNSHAQWHSPLKSEKNWKDYNTLDFKTTKNDKTFSEDKYLKAAKYQYDYLTKFIAENADENTIFVLFGDHQPPKITTKEMGKNTPLYIISKDEDFVNSFHKEGFHNHLDLHTIEKTIKHEGFYTLFTKKLLENYGVGHENFKILPDGIIP